MATGKKITGLAEFSAVPAIDDYSIVVDVSDPTHSVNGTTKKVSHKNNIGYTEYVALVTQTGTNAPTAVDIKNDTGATVAWARSNAGIYTATFSSAVLTANKTIASIVPYSNYAHWYYEMVSTSVVRIYIVNNDALPMGIDAQLTSSPVTIRIYV